MKLTEVATQRFEDNITSITPGALKGGLMAVDRHPTREEVAVGGADGVPKLFRIYREKGKERKIGDDFNLIRNYDTMPGRLFDVQFSRDGSRLVCGSSKDNTGEVRVYQTDDAKLVSKLADCPRRRVRRGVQPRRHASGLGRLRRPDSPERSGHRPVDQGVSRRAALARGRGEAVECFKHPLAA